MPQPTTVQRGPNSSDNSLESSPGHSLLWDSSDSTQSLHENTEMINYRK
jgi:hypothetical protein